MQSIAKTGGVGLLLALLLILPGCLHSPTRGWPSAPMADEYSMPRTIDELNRFRNAHGVPSVRESGTLTKVAALQAQYQAATKKMSHFGLRGADLGVRLNRFGYRYRVAGENVSFNRRGERDVVEAWARSPSHRDLLLDRQMDEVGVAAAVDSDGRPYWSMVLASPAPIPASARLRPSGM